VKANGVSGNFLDVETREEYWISGVKKRGSNVHWAESASVKIDDDAATAYRELKAGK
jgi:Ca2+-dependent lipid-binding protein